MSSSRGLFGFAGKSSVCSRQAKCAVIATTVFLALAVLVSVAWIWSLRGNTSQQRAVSKSSAPLKGEAALTHLKETGQYDSLAAAMQAARYQVQWTDSTPLGAGAYHAPNPAQDYNAFINSQGVTVKTRLAQLSLSLQAIGYGERMQSVRSNGDVKSSSDRIEIQHQAEITEWFLNRPTGLEHGFTLPAALSERRDGERLRLMLSLGGDLRATAESEGQAISFRNPEGAEVVRYGGLLVTDAQGRKLPARMTVVGDQLAFEVDDAAAVYPVRIDPSFVQQTKLNPSDGEAQDDFGQAVAISGDTAVIGAFLDDIGANANQGSAYVFVRSGTIWAVQQKLTASDGAANDWFGLSLAISGDTVVIGAVSDDIGANVDEGSAYVFVRSGTAWSQQQKLTATDNVDVGNFSNSVSISGETVVVGANGTDAGGNLDSGSAYVFVRSGMSWSQQQKLTAADGAVNDLFGTSVAISGDTAVVGADTDDNGANADQGSAYVFVRSGITWSLQQKLTAFDGLASDRFGVASAISGDTILIGASQDDVGANVNQGSAYVFVRSGVTWSLQQKLIASNGAAGDEFGYRVALSGNVAVTGGYQHDVGANADQGLTYVFSRSGATWNQQQVLAASDGGAGDLFGHFVALDGNTLIVGAHLDDIGSNANQGSAYVFVQSGTSWSQQQKLTATGGAAVDLFGASVAISGDTVVVGADDENIGANPDQGSAYVFVRSGVTWSQQQKLTAPDGAADDDFGTSVAISGDTLAVGAGLDDIGPNSNQGSAYVFVRSGTTWSQQQKLTALDGAADDYFGFSIAISNDTVVAGAYGDDVGPNSNQGSAYVFVRSGVTWSQQQKLTASDGAAFDIFGRSIAISNDTMIVGAGFDDIGANPDQGSVYVYVRSGITWSQQQKLTASDGAANDSFGTSVAISGETAVIGANLDDVGASANQGSAYVFVRSGITWSQQNKLTALDGTASDNFGISVAVSGDTAIVGAYLDDVGPNTDQGSAYIFAIPACTYAIAPTSAAFTTSGGSGSVNVTTNGSDCAWTATESIPWLTLTFIDGLGDGPVNYTVDPNPTTSPRSGVVTVAGNSFYVTQAAAGVLVQEDFSGGIPPTWTVINGGTGSYNNGDPLTWTTSNPCNQMFVPPFSNPVAIMDATCVGPDLVLDEELRTPAFDATGLGTVYVEFFSQFKWSSLAPNNKGDVDVSINGGTSWTNVLRLENGNDGVPTPVTKSINITPVIAGNPANVLVRMHYYGTSLPSQLRPTRPEAQEISWGIDFSIYSFQLGSTSQNFPASGGSGNVTLTTSVVVPSPKGVWTVTSNAPWITPAVQGGTGNGSVGYVVASNPVPVPRTGTMTISGQTFTVTQAAGVCPTITINPATLPGGVLSVGYNQTLTASGATAPYNYAITAGALPNGLNLSAGGALTGTPTQAGTFNFTARATDANGCQGTRAYSLVISSDACGAMTPITLGQTVNGSLGAGDCLLSDGSFADLYSFNATAGQQVAINLTSAQFDAYLILLAPNGSNLAFNDDGGGGTNALIPPGNGLITLPATGTYTIYANSFSAGGTGAYTLTLTGGGTSNGLQFYPLASPVRLLDTRTGVSGCVTGTGAIAANDTRTQAARTACSTIPANATAIIGNITVVPSGPGFLTLFPSDATQPTVANSNFTAGEVTNNFFTVGLGAGDGAFKIFTSATTNVIIDITGYYAPPSLGGLYYHPLSSPVRLVETRGGFSGCVNPARLTGTNNPNANPALDLPVQGRLPGLPSPCNAIPSNAVVLVGNATTIFPDAPLGFGYLTIYPSDAARPTVASSNYGNGDIINGPFAVKLGADGKFKIYTFSSTDLVVDIAGYYSALASDENGAGLLFNPLPKPMRLLETRNIPGFPLVGCYKPGAPISGGEGGIRTQQVWGTCSDQPITMPTTARAVVGNVTVINPTSAGFGTFFPGNVGTAPTVATTNYPFPVTFGYNRHYYVGLSPVNGTFKVLTFFTSDYIVDVSGYFAP